MLAKEVSSPARIKLIVKRLGFALQTIGLGATQGRFRLLDPSYVIVRFDFHQKVPPFDGLPDHYRQFNDFSGDLRRNLDFDFRPDFSGGGDNLRDILDLGPFGRDGDRCGSAPHNEPTGYNDRQQTRERHWPSPFSPLP